MDGKLVDGRRRWRSGEGEEDGGGEPPAARVVRSSSMSMSRSFFDA